MEDPDLSKLPSTSLKDLYNLYGRRVYNTALSIVQNSADAAEKLFAF